MNSKDYRDVLTGKKEPSEEFGQEAANQIMAMNNIENIITNWNNLNSDKEKIHAAKEIAKLSNVLQELE